MNTANQKAIITFNDYGQLTKVHTLYKLHKRVLDVTVSLIALLLLSPILVIVCLMVRLSSRGSSIYWQERVGLNGEIIKFPKIRSMVKNAESLLENIKSDNDHEDSLTFKMKKDPRVTWIGRIIRKLSIDELPQLWLVLKGDLTLVGPRPALVDEVEKYTFHERQRLLVKPGLTCIWQVSGRGDIAFREQVNMDLDYIRKRSLLLDLKLLLLTVPAVLTGKGAY